MDYFSMLSQLILITDRWIWRQISANWGPVLSFVFGTNTKTFYSKAWQDKVQLCQKQDKYKLTRWIGKIIAEIQIYIGELWFFVCLKLHLFAYFIVLWTKLTINFALLFALEIRDQYERICSFLIVYVF